MGDHMEHEMERRQIIYHTADPPRKQPPLLTPRKSIQRASPAIYIQVSITSQGLHHAEIFARSRSTPTTVVRLHRAAPISSNLPPALRATLLYTFVRSSYPYAAFLLTDYPPRIGSSFSATFSPQSFVPPALFQMLASPVRALYN